MATIQKRKNGDVYYLYLDYTENGQRTQESMGLKLFVKPKTLSEKSSNQETMRSAQSLIAAKVMELNGFKSGLVSNEQKNIDILIGFKEWADAYVMKDDRVAIQAYNWFEKYCDENRIQRLSSATLQVSFIDAYGQWLNTQFVTQGMRSRGEKILMAKETRIKIFRKLRTYLTLLFKDGLLSWPPQLITAKWKRDKSRVKKKTLTGVELEKLLTIPYPIDPYGNSKEVICRAFIFCINTGLDYSTVSKLTWANINASFLSFARGKTGKENRLKLNKTALDCLPKTKDGLLFALPSHPTCMKWVRQWAKDAKIPDAEKFTWHSARHNLGMILGNEKNVPPAVLMKIYGHSDIKETMKYYEATDLIKEEAMDLIG